MYFIKNDLDISVVIIGCFIHFVFHKFIPFSMLTLHLLLSFLSRAKQTIIMNLKEGINSQQHLHYYHVTTELVGMSCINIVIAGS